MDLEDSTRQDDGGNKRRKGRALFVRGLGVSRGGRSRAPRNYGERKIFGVRKENRREEKKFNKSNCCRCTPSQKLQVVTGKEGKG